MNLRKNVCILYAFSIIVCIIALNSHVYKLCKMPMKNVLLNSRELNFTFTSCMATMCIFDQNMNKRRKLSLHIYIKVIITDVKSKTTIFFFVNVRVLYWTRVEMFSFLTAIGPYVHPFFLWKPFCMCFLSYLVDLPDMMVLAFNSSFICFLFTFWRHKLVSMETSSGYI